LRSRKAGFCVGFKIAKNRFSGTQKPVLTSKKTAFGAGKNRFWRRQKPVLRWRKTGSGVGENWF